MIQGTVLRVSEDVAWDLTLMAWGAYQPLNAPMGPDDYHSVCQTMRLANGQLFPIPVVIPVPSALTEVVRGSREMLVVGPAEFLAQLAVDQVFFRDLPTEAQLVYGTQDPAHPGVARLLSLPPWGVSGTVTLLRPAHSSFPEPAHPEQVRRIIAERGWQTVAAFQTRNPVHRGHEYLHKVALELCDGLLLHPLTGLTKQDDIPADIRMQSYRLLIAAYYPAPRVVLAVFPAAMRYGGPREALFHAIVRRNYGASHFIVGRDAAGFADFYGPREAMRLVEKHSLEIGIVPLSFDAVGYCPVCTHTVSERTCPHKSQWRMLSGTAVRERLRAGIGLPEEFSRPEVSDYLLSVLQKV